MLRLCSLPEREIPFSAYVLTRWTASARSNVGPDHAFYLLESETDSSDINHADLGLNHGDRES